jgi:hypothetical protein
LLFGKNINSVVVVVIIKIYTLLYKYKRKMNPEEAEKQFDKEIWNTNHKMRKNRLQKDTPLPPPLNLGAPAIDYVKEIVFLAKKDNPTYSSKEIFYDILKQSIPLYKFKDVYSVDDLSSRFNVYQLEEQKKKYLSNGVPQYEIEFIDELIKAAKDKREAFLKCEADKAGRMVREYHEDQNKLSCAIMGGKIKNTFRKKNKSKRVNKRIKKNKRYSRKYSSKSSSKSLKK